MDKKRVREKIEEVYRNSGLGKWFHDESADDEPGWDRYNTKGERVGKCGDSKPGEGKPKCLSKQKAAKLRSKGGKKAIANAVRRKRKKDPKQDRPGTGNKPINVSNKLEDSYMNIKELESGMAIMVEDTICFVEKVSRISESAYKVDFINEHAERGHEFFLKTDEIEFVPEELDEEKETKRKLNKPFRTPGGPKKFSVYVKNEKGNVVKVNFGDPNMEIKRDDPNRRKSFRARHNCANPGPKTKARYWSCYQWRGGSKVADSYEPVGDSLMEDCGCGQDLVEENIPTSPDKWSDCISQAKKKFDVYPSAYANAWAAKCYKKKGGGWKKGKKKVNEQHISSKEKKETENSLIKQLKSKGHFSKMSRHNRRKKKDIHNTVANMIITAKDLFTPKEREIR